MKVAVTGYNGSGSSAVLDLLKEYRNCSGCCRRSYEHILLYTPNSLFDLEYKLLFGNNIHRSDEALESFKNEMIRLYRNDFGWCGGYKKLFGHQFIEMIDCFIDNLCQFRINGKWSYDLIGLKYDLAKLLRDSVRVILGKTVYEFGKSYKQKKDNVIMCSFVDKVEFYTAAKDFIELYMKLFNEEESDNIIFDHLLMPHDAWRIKNYFNDDFRLIIVDRDVRDMYLLAKYIRPYNGVETKYPIEINQFIQFWKYLRMIERESSDRVLRVYFEDLVYDYESTISKIEEFTGFKQTDHEKRKTLFSPEKAIHNTQFFNINKEWEQEVAVLEKVLIKYIYNYPYKHTSILERTFN